MFLYPFLPVQKLFITTDSISYIVKNQRLLVKHYAPYVLNISLINNLSRMVFTLFVNFILRIWINFEFITTLCSTNISIPTNVKGSIPIVKGDYWKRY